jgi:hypothetical protein
MKIALLSLTLLALVAATVACSCLPASLQAHYYAPQTTRVVRALVTSKRTQPCQNCKVFYKIKVLEAFKGCKTPDVLEVSTEDNSAACGVDLKVGTKYLLYLSSAKVQSINLCQGIQRFSDLSPSNLAFLKSRNVCCGGQCSCLPGAPLVRCFVAPCNPRVKPPCPEATKCVSSYCSTCAAEWFKKDGSPACV